MMPVIRVSDAAFLDLKTIATWHGSDTPSKAIDLLVRKEMERLDLERDEPQTGSNPELPTGEPVVFEKTPGLSFTRVISAKVDRRKIENPKWISILLATINVVKAKGLSSEQLSKELQIPSKVGPFEDSGFKYSRSLNISLQGQSAPDAWNETERLSKRYGIPVEVEFQWRENPKAQHPGRVGVLRSES